MSKPSRIGILGGTFDPIHNTHVAIARAAIDQLGLDRVHFVVAAAPPHKKAGAYADGEIRYAMVEAAVAGEEGMEASRVELDRGGTSYTIDTVTHFREASPDAELFVIVGADSLVDLPRWKDPEGILERAHLLVVPRAEVGQQAPREVEGHFTFLDFPETPLSSTEVRRRIEDGEPIGDLAPPGVEAIIREQDLYRARVTDSSK